MKIRLDEEEEDVFNVQGREKVREWEREKKRKTKDKD